MKRFFILLTVIMLVLTGCSGQESKTELTPSLVVKELVDQETFAFFDTYLSDEIIDAVYMSSNSSIYIFKNNGKCINVYKYENTNGADEYEYTAYSNAVKIEGDYERAFEITNDEGLVINADWAKGDFRIMSAHKNVEFLNLNYVNGTSLDGLELYASSTPVKGTYVFGKDTVSIGDEILDYYFDGQHLSVTNEKGDVYIDGYILNDGCLHLSSMKLVYGKINREGLPEYSK